MERKKLSLALMDGPYENARTVSALRILDAAIRRGYDLTVFAYEGAVALAFARQAQHANAVHGHDVEQEDHPLPKDWIVALIESARRHGGQLDWINCGLCVDERGVAESIPGVRRGSPADFWQAAAQSNGTLVIGAK
jgi:tRNA 2-thiouridine synthesizing protein D